MSGAIKLRETENAASGGAVQERFRLPKSSSGKYEFTPLGVPPVAREQRDGFVGFELSRRGKQYLATAQTLLRTAQTMTDRVIASQLRSLADDLQRRAEKASRDDAAKALARATARLSEASEIEY
jgi:hypothetical protein